MKYNNILPAVFVSRPNRFIAEIELEGRVEICHVKNTGRCRELLTHGARVYVQKSDNPKRKTKYDLISVFKGGELVNIDSQAPNKVFGEWVSEGNFIKNISLIKPECRYKNSRFDFYMEADGRKIFAEIKGVTLEENGTAMFPDAPTERGVKHIGELCECIADGFEAYIFFVIQMKGCRRLIPNRKTHREFADALSEAESKGVHIHALSCRVTPDELRIDEEVEVRTDGGQA